MKALLLHRDRDFELEQELPVHAGTLTEDLELGTLLRAMSGGDSFLETVAQKAILSGLQNDAATILYRQDIAKDCLKNSAVVRELYSLAVQAIERRRKSGYYGYVGGYPRGILHSAVEALQILTAMLRKLKDIADARAYQFKSTAFTTLFAMLQREFSDDYFASIQDHLGELKFRRGILVSVELGDGNAARDYVLRRARGKGPNWFMRLLGQGEEGYTFRLHERDDAGAQILSDMQNIGINLVANALAQSADHIVSFFEMLRTELAFYVGCLNLQEKLASLGVPTSFPQIEPVGARPCRFHGLQDISLALTFGRGLVSNDLDADGKGLVVITGANQGGKSSFMRAVGLAELMAQCGMFVAAESWAVEMCSGVYTHYKREEDATMKSGKLDEELNRMSEIVESILPNAMLLFNESFASTNEREGSEIARQIVRALLERGIRVFFVTHLYEFAHRMFEDQRKDSLFLRAERRPDGTRTYRLVGGEPLETSYGEDLYTTIFHTEKRDNQT